MAAVRCFGCLQWHQLLNSSHVLTAPCLHPSMLRLSRCAFSDFYHGTDSVSPKKLTTEDVNKRMYENEFFCFPRDKSIGFTANQIDVNRPVEDRWSAFRIGGAIAFGDGASTARTSADIGGFYDSLHPLYPFAKDFPGGHLFTVVDGHAGHTCAHAVNMLHADYITVALLPQHLEVPVYHLLCRHEVPDAPPQATKLAQPYLTDPAAVMTLSLDDSGATDGPFTHDGRHRNWRIWGQWGPLDAVVNQRRLQNIHRMMKERIATADCDENNECILHANGNVYDHDGFLVCEGNEFNSNELRRITATATALRRGLLRLDSDIVADAVPDPENGVNKNLLRIVLSGCVATSVYIPDDLSALYVAQVGDCGAVLGKHTGNSSEDQPHCDIESDPVFTNSSLLVPPPRTAAPSTAASGASRAVDQGEFANWKAELLVAPHNSQNLRDVERIQSQHPIHEASTVIADDRLLGELMPLRAFGDIRYKLPGEVLHKIVQILEMPPYYSVKPRFYTSPPYLFATPQVVCRRLDKQRDKFIILATDGLWDMLTPDEAVAVVAKHFLDYKGDPSEAPPRDTAASRLIRAALGGGRAMNPDSIAAHLAVRANVARFYRDDITVQVIYPTHPHASSNSTPPPHWCT